MEDGSPRQSPDDFTLDDALRLLRRFVHREPACSPNQAADALGIDVRKILAHLKPPAIQHHIAIFKAPGRGHYLLPARPGLEDCWQQILLLRQETTKQLHEMLLELGRSRWAEIAATTQEREGWSPRTTHHRLSRLVDAGLVSRSKRDVQDQRWIWYQATHPQPVAKAILDSASRPLQSELCE